jgi:hypothetical protein
MYRLYSLVAPLGSGTLATTPVTIPASGWGNEIEGQGTGGQDAGVEVVVGGGVEVVFTITSGSAVFPLWEPL